MPPDEFFASFPTLDWTDLTTTAPIAERLIRSFAADKALFAATLLDVPNDPARWARCEEDVVEDKIVLWDCPEKDFRIRLRMSTASQERLAHSHRFSFTNLVLRGEYLHWGYHLDSKFDETTLESDFATVFVHEDRANDCFTIAHDALHSTPFPNLGVVSLVLRGNPVKARAPVMFKEARGRDEAFKQARVSADVEPRSAKAGDMFWRVGEDLESAERRAERRMTREKFDHWVARLREFGII